MRKAIWIAGCLLLTALPYAQAADITINITEDDPNSLMVNIAGSDTFKPYKAMTLATTPTPPAATGWEINTQALTTSFIFQKSSDANVGSTFYFQEPSSGSAFVNVVFRLPDAFGRNLLWVASDVATPNPAPNIVFNGKPQMIGKDDAGNNINIVFNDSLLPDPSDMTPEPASLFLAGSGLVLAIQVARSRKPGTTPAA